MPEVGKRERETDYTENKTKINNYTALTNHLNTPVTLYRRCLGKTAT